MGALLLVQGCTSVSLEDAAPAGSLGPSRSTVAAAPEPEPLPRVVPSVGDLAPVDESSTSLELIEDYATTPVVRETRVRQPGAREIVVSETGENVTSAVATVDGMGPSAPLETGQFPNLNLRPRIATRQFSPGESNEKAKELASARSQLKSDVTEIPLDKKEAERLRKLGQSHGKDVLKRIERR